MAEVEHRGDFEEAMRKNILSQYREKQRLCSLARGLGAAAQEFEDAFTGVSSDVLFCNATGFNLNLYGALVGEDRGDLNDILYRRVIDARILANASDGTEDAIWGVLRVLVPDGPGVVVTSTAKFPATVSIQIRTPDRPDLEFLARTGKILRLAKAAGISLGGAWAVDTAFGFDLNPDTLGYDQGQLAYSI